MTGQRGRVARLEAQAFRLLTAAELQALDLEELTAYIARLDRWAGSSELADFQKRLEAMTDGELLAFAAEFQPGQEGQP